MRLCIVAYLAFLLSLSFAGLVTANEATEEAKLGLFDRLIRIVKGEGSEEVFPMPKCMFTMSGGIDQIERQLQDETEKGKTWSILITSRNDATSLPAVKAYYDAVRQLCGEEEEITPQSGELEGAVQQQQQNAFEDHSPQDAYTFDPSVLDRIAFAHMSFDQETGMMWRWWIWKVPTIVFVSSPTSSLRSYDVRFWKIAFSIPSSERLIAIIKDQIWQELPVWESSFAPGGEYQNLARFFSKGSLGFTSVLEPIPNWLLGILASMFGSMLLSYLHRNDAKPTQQSQPSTNNPESRKTQ